MVLEEILSLQQRIRRLEQQAALRGDTRIGVTQSPAGGLASMHRPAKCWAKILASESFTDEFNELNYRHSWQEVNVSRVDGSVADIDGGRRGVMNLLDVNRIRLDTGRVIRIEQDHRGLGYWWSNVCLCTGLCGCPETYPDEFTAVISNVSPVSCTGLEGATFTLSGNGAGIWTGCYVYSSGISGFLHFACAIKVIVSCDTPTGFLVRALPVSGSRALTPYPVGEIECSQMFIDCTVFDPVTHVDCGSPFAFSGTLTGDTTISIDNCGVALGFCCSTITFDLDIVE